MLTKYRRQLLNYCLDVALEKHGQRYQTDVNLSHSRVRSSIIDIFTHRIVVEDYREYMDSVRSKRVHVMVEKDLINASIYCLEETMTHFNESYRKIIRLDVREHRIKIRSIFVELLSQRYRKTQLEGLARAQRHIKQEKENLQHEGE